MAPPISKSDLKSDSELESVSKSLTEEETKTKLRDARVSGVSYPATALTDLDHNCLSLILSFTSPADVCRLASVSKSFAEASLSNTVWESFLPSGISHVLKEYNCLEVTDSLIDDSLFYDPETLKFRSAYRVLTKGLFINEGRQKIEIDKISGDFVVYISVVENLTVIWGDDPQYWWMENGIPKATFTKTAHLLDVCWFQIKGRISCFLPMGKYICFWRLARDSVDNPFYVSDTESPPSAPSDPGTARGINFRWKSRYKANSKVTRYRDGDATDKIKVAFKVTSDGISECARGEWTEVVVGEVTIGREDVKAREDGREGEAGFLDLGLQLMEVKDVNYKSGLYVDSFVLRRVRNN